MIDLQSLKDFFPIEGKLVKLDIFSEKNITDAYLGWLNDPAVVRFSNQRFRRHTRQTALDYLQSFKGTENLFLAVYLKNDNKYIGTMNVYFSAAHETADIGIMIGDRACWGAGVGSDAWLTMLSFLLDTVKVRKVTGGALGCNAGMIKIMAKAGMKPDGVRMAQELMDSQPQDILHFAKFRDA